MTHIAVDAMGGDHAPSAIVDGAVAAVRRLGVVVSLVGATRAIERALDPHPGWREAGINIVDALSSRCASRVSSLPLLSSSPIDSRPTRGDGMPNATRA